MARQANGNYVQPANTAAVSGQSVSSTAFNSLITDIGTEITNSLDRNGRSAMAAALPMGSNKITGMADPTVSTDAATKNYVDTTTATFFSTGDVKLTLKTTADSGWVFFDDGTIGSASSGASSRANADTLALFTLLFNGPFTDTTAPIFTAGGAATTRAAQVSASAAWAANCRITLLKSVGRALGIQGSGAGLATRAHGSTFGEEAHTLTAGELPGHTHSGTTGAMNANAAHTHTVLALQDSGAQAPNSAAAFHTGGSSNASITSSSTNTDHTHNFTTDNGTSGGIQGFAHNNMQPTLFINAMVKL